MCDKNGPCMQKMENVTELMCAVAAVTLQLSQVTEADQMMSRQLREKLIAQAVERSMAIIAQFEAESRPPTWSAVRVYVAEMLRASLNDLGNPLPLERREI